MIPIAAPGLTFPRCGQFSIIRYGFFIALMPGNGTGVLPRPWPFCAAGTAHTTQAVAMAATILAARGATPSAFERRCIPPPPQRGCRVGDPGPGGVAPPSNTPGIATPPRKPRAAGAPVLGRRALPSGRIAALGATMDLHHELLEFIRLEDAISVAPLFTS